MGQNRDDDHRKDAPQFGHDILHFNRSAIVMITPMAAFLPIQIEFRILVHHYEIRLKIHEKTHAIRVHHLL